MNNQCSQNAHLEIFPDWINIVVGKYSGEELTQLVSWQRLQHHVGRAGPGQDTSFYPGKSQKPVGILHAGEVRFAITHFRNSP